MNAHEKRVTARLYATNRMKPRVQTFAANCQWCGRTKTKTPKCYRVCTTCDEPEKKVTA